MRFRLGLAMACLLLLTLIVTAPARLLGLIVSSETLLLQGVSGSVWRGSAARALVAAGHGYVHLGEVSWELSPLSLFTLAPKLKLESHWGNQDVSAQLSLRNRTNFDIRDLDATVSSGLLRQFTPLMVGGDFSMQFARLSVRHGLPTAVEGRLLWRNATWLSNQGSRPLGSYAIDLRQEEGETLSAEVVTVAGPINVAGNVALDVRRYQVDLLLDSEAGLDAQLDEALTLFAQPVGDADATAYRIQMNGELQEYE